ncbi:MAG: hypothetical protein ACRD3Q_02110 [Terriglobales bacterium]
MARIRTEIKTQRPRIFPGTGNQIVDRPASTASSQLDFDIPYLDAKDFSCGAARPGWSSGPAFRAATIIRTYRGVKVA